MRLDAHSTLTALEVSAAVTAGYLVMVGVVVLAALPRLRQRWKAHQPAQVPMAGTDPKAVQDRLVEVLRPWGFRPAGESGGPFVLEPHGLRQLLGATRITLGFPAGQDAVVTGEARYVAKLTTDRKVLFISEGAVPFWPWVRRRLMVPVVAATVILFVGVVLIFLSF